MGAHVGHDHEDGSQQGCDAGEQPQQQQGASEQLDHRRDPEHVDAQIDPEEIHAPKQSLCVFPVQFCPAMGHEHGAAEHSQQQPGKDLTLLCDTFNKASH